jgi:beta-1,4-mannosyl-glycoprotein beta-1,4-N-acetylglucosaminyltransferase
MIAVLALVALIAKGSVGGGSAPARIERLVVVTLVDGSNPTDVAGAELMFRSLLATNQVVETCAPDSIHDEGCVSLIELHACVSSGVPGAGDWNMLSNLTELGVQLRRLNDRHYPGDMLLNGESSVGNGTVARSFTDHLRCSAQVGEDFGNYSTANVMFISNKYLVLRSIRAKQLSVLKTEYEGYFLCHPAWHKVVDGIRLPGYCNLDMFVFPAPISVELSSMLNYSAVEAMEITTIDNLLREVILTFQYFNGLDVVYGGADLDVTVDADSFAFIEFDGREHVAYCSDCLIHVFIEWPSYNTLPMVSELFSSIVYSSNEISLMMCGCGDELIKQRRQSQLAHYESLLMPDSLATSEPITKLRVFNIIIFNDEIELLLLKLDALDASVDYHVIVEAEQTFTGKPKPLHYHVHRELFRRYWHKIVHVVIQKLPHQDISETSQIWENEYFSRNSAHDGLISGGVTDGDIIIVADVDEIPYPSAIDSLRRLLLPVRRPWHRIYRLYPMNFLYDFDCFAGVGGLLRGGSAVATTWRMMKRTGPLDEYISNTRHYLQASNRHYPRRNVLYPGSTHLSFFGGMDRIQSKLTSYSHQNFARKYGDDTTPGNVTAISNVSVEMVAETIAAGLNINGNAETSNCRRVVFDDFTRTLQTNWVSIIHNKSDLIESVEIPTSRSVYMSNEGQTTDPESASEETAANSAGSNAATTALQVAFVTGCVMAWEDDVYVPAPVKHAGVDSFFVINDLDIAEQATALGYIAVVLAHIPTVNASTEVSIVNAMHSKLLKVFPQMLASRATGKTYDFVIWMDNKYDIDWQRAWATINNWPQNAAVMMPRPVVCCGINKTFNDCMKQERYAIGRNQLQAYIDKQVNEGFSLTEADPRDDHSFATGFIVYNMHHENTTKIQALWYEHIQQAGIQCQISMFFVAQRFRQNIAVYHERWFTLGRIVFHKTYEDAMKLVNFQDEAEM